MLQGSPLTATLVNGVATFSGLFYDVAEPMNVQFTSSSGSVASINSNTIVVSPNVAAQIVVTQQPSATATAGVYFALPPVVAEEDAFGNVEVGDSSHTVTVARGSLGTGTLQGSNLTVALVNGVAAFSGLSYDVAQTMNLAFSTNAGGFTTTSNSVVVSPAAASRAGRHARAVGDSDRRRGVRNGADGQGRGCVWQRRQRRQHIDRDGGARQPWIGQSAREQPDRDAGQRRRHFRRPVLRCRANDESALHDRRRRIHRHFEQCRRQRGSGEPARGHAATIEHGDRWREFAVQPMVTEEDPFGNVVLSDSGSTVTAASGSLGAGTLQGSNLTVTLVNGVANFAGLSYDVAQTIDLAFITDAGASRRPPTISPSARRPPAS